MVSCICCCLSSFLQKTTCFCCIHRGVQKRCQNLCCILVWIHCLNKKGAVILFVLTITARNVTLRITMEFMNISTCYYEEFTFPLEWNQTSSLIGMSSVSLLYIPSRVQSIKFSYALRCVTEIMNHTAAVYRCKFSRFVAFWGSDTHTHTHTHTQVLTLQVASNIFLDMSPTQN